MRIYVVSTNVGCCLIDTKYNIDKGINWIVRMELLPLWESRLNRSF